MVFRFGRLSSRIAVEGMMQSPSRGPGRCYIISFGNLFDGNRLACPPPRACHRTLLIRQGADHRFHNVAGGGARRPSVRANAEAKAPGGESWPGRIGAPFLWGWGPGTQRSCAKSYACAPERAERHYDSSARQRSKPGVRTMRARSGSVRATPMPSQRKSVSKENRRWNPLLTALDEAPRCIRPAEMDGHPGPHV